MGLELRQQMVQKQQLQQIMTPQLQMAIRLLQLSRMELAETIQQELTENPVLEETPESGLDEDSPGGVDSAASGVDDEKFAQENQSKEKEEDAQPTLLSNMDWDNYSDQYSVFFRSNNDDDEMPSFESTTAKKTTLAEHLEWQLQVSSLTPKEKQIANEIIYNLDDDGRLCSPLSEISEEVGTTEEIAEGVLEKIQEFDPIGVAARDLRECLVLQTRHLNLGEKVEKVILDHLPNLEKRNFRAIAKDLRITEDEVKELAKLICHLEPKPGRPFSGGETQYITPDIYVYKIGNELVPILNDDGMPKLRVSNFYRDVMQNKNKGSFRQEKAYIKDKLQSATWLIRSIHQRHRTIYKVMQSIIKFQAEFFEHGVACLKPLVLRDVADDVGMHESTISRVTTNKYAHTPQGIFELKFFFNSGIMSSDGDSISSESIKNKILKLIAKEDEKKPLSDQNIVDILSRASIDIARRTVTKYRKMLRIPPSSKRKKLF